ncbi:hypothetical protein G6F59_015991 [Rhizopus arrhizus]|nr:hypothetical protein G6F59_015991 [Rhizopus arrhizus]
MTLRIEEFLPERMKMALTSEQEVLSVGDDLTGDRDRFALAQQWPGFIFGDVADDSRRSFGELPEAALDDKGYAQLEVPSSSAGTHSPMKLRVSASLLESGGRPVVRSIERSVWPADKLIGVRPQFDTRTAGPGPDAPVPRRAPVLLAFR